MVILSLLLACASHRSVAELEARVAELEAERAAQTERIAALEAQVTQLAAVPSTDVLTTSPTGEGPHCELVDGRLLLPAEGLEADQLSRAARVIPHRGADGEMDGYRISGVRRGALLDTCGFKNGDLLHAVNGVPVTNAEQGLAAYAAAQSATVLRVHISRRGTAEVVELHRVAASE